MQYPADTSDASRAATNRSSGSHTLQEWAARCADVLAAHWQSNQAPCVEAMRWRGDMRLQQRQRRAT